MSDPFSEDLRARTLDRVTRTAPQAIAVLGYTPAALGVRAALTAAGLTDRLLGI